MQRLQIGRMYFLRPTSQRRRSIVRKRKCTRVEPRVNTPLRNHRSFAALSIAKSFSQSSSLAISADFPRWRSRRGVQTVRRQHDATRRDATRRRRRRARYDSYEITILFSFIPHYTFYFGELGRRENVITRRATLKSLRIDDIIGSTRQREAITSCLRR